MPFLNFNRGDAVVHNRGSRPGQIGIVEDVAPSMIGIRYPDRRYETAMKVDCFFPYEDKDNHGYDID